MEENGDKANGAENGNGNGQEDKKRGSRGLDDLRTCPDDPRFQQTNAATWCWRMFVDYHRCCNLMGDNASQCNYFSQCYKSLCPNEWHERWTEQLEAGTFPFDVSRDRQPKPGHCP